jgi:NAD dependent epimerase/dehydratase family enzyme
MMEGKEAYNHFIIRDFLLLSRSSCAAFLAGICSRWERTGLHIRRTKVAVQTAGIFMDNSS